MDWSAFARKVVCDTDTITYDLQNSHKCLFMIFGLAMTLTCEVLTLKSNLFIYVRNCI